LGGILSNVLHYAIGMTRLGHEVVLVEKAGYPNSCYDPVRDEMSDDCEYGVSVAHALLARFGLGDRWSYVDAAGAFHGMSAREVRRAFRLADVFVDYGSHGSWADEAEHAGCRVLIDGEPGYRQVRWAQSLAAGESLPAYDFYFTNGFNVGTAASNAPTAGREWHHVFHPITVDLVDAAPPRNGARVTTVMNWQSHETIEHEGVRLGQKDVEFEKFRTLPQLVSTGLEVAVAGNHAPLDELVGLGWHVRNAHEATISYDSFFDYIAGSRAEFSVCKEVFVALNTGWFSDRSAAYLAAGRPVILEETGFSAHLPTGTGLFAVRTTEEAAEAVAAVEADYDRHARRAREIALEYLDGRAALRGLFETVGV
jgi:hypothetical protein